MRPRHSSATTLLAPLAILGLIVPITGCSSGSPSTEIPELVPVSGTVRVDGQPLAGAVVTFLQTDERGTTGNGETDEEGRYELQAMNSTGVAPGRYQVGISYLMPPSGKPVGLSARSSLAPVADLAVAEELVPPRYSDLGRTELEVTVPDEGGTLDFDLEGPLLDPPVADETDTAPSDDEAEGSDASSEDPTADPS